MAPGFFITKASYADDIREIDIVRIGALCDDDNNNNCGQYYEDRSVQDMFVHPEYENGGPNLMLVKLTQSSTVNPAIMDEGSLASSYENDFEGRELYTAGFGVIDNMDVSQVSTKLLELKQRYIRNADCFSLAENSNAITDSVICAMNDDESKSPCYKDGGGPLWDPVAKKLVGIVSTGPSSCQGFPVIYEGIGTQYQWIKSTICKNHKSGVDFDEDEPEPTFCSNDTYFRVVSHHEDSGGTWCLTRANALSSSRVIVERCNPDNDLQLWRIDRRGQMRSYNNDDLCMRNIQKKKKIAMKDCISLGQPVGFSFIFDPMNHSLIWLKSNADFMTYGLRAISIMNTPDDSDSQSRIVHVKARSDKKLMKWYIEYPSNL